MIEIRQYVGIILEALEDYRRWFQEDAADSDNLDQLKIDEIDGAILAIKHGGLI